MTYQSKIEIPELHEIEVELRPLLEHWLHINSNTNLPAWRNWDWLQVPMKVIPWCAVVDVIGDCDDFRHRFWGTARRDLFNFDYTKRLVSEMKPITVAEKSRRELTETRQFAKPTYISTSQYEFNGRVSDYHMLRLPFGVDGTVKQVLSAVAFQNTDIRTIHKFMTGTPESPTLLWSR